LGLVIVHVRGICYTQSLRLGLWACSSDFRR